MRRRIPRVRINTALLQCLQYSGAGVQGHLSFARETAKHYRDTTKVVCAFDMTATFAH
jgi:hypothetical protein